MVIDTDLRLIESEERFRRHPKRVRQAENNA